MKLFNELQIDIGYVLLATMGVLLTTIIMVLILLIKNRNLKKKYDAFMSGSDGKSLEESIQYRFKQIDDIKEVLKNYKKHFDQIDESLLNTVQKIGLVKYDAFREMGGKLSFVLVMLNDKNNGFILNSMHSSREGCYTYIKEIVGGEAFVVLSEEEIEALQQAVHYNEV